MKSKLIISLLALALLLPPMGAANSAEITTATADTDIVVGSHTLKIMKGSAYESLSVSGGTLTVTVPDGEAFELRYPGPWPMGLENGGYAEVCNVLTTRDNQLIISGARTVTVIPNTAPCDMTNYGDDTTPFLSFSVPNGTETLSAGNQLMLFWSTSGRTVPSVSIKLSTDGGATFPTTMASGLINNGYYNWTVPEVPLDATAKLKIIGFDNSRAVALGVSAGFVVRGTEAREGTEGTEEEPLDYDPAVETAAATTIGDDKGIVQVDLPSGTVTCQPNSRIKPMSSSAVYYCGADNKRYVFPNQKTHDTWYGDFGGVIELDDATIAQIPLGGNVTYRPGVRLVKIQTDPKVYAVAGGGILRWVSSEAVALALYGANWNQMVDDVPDAFFVNYVIGEAIE